MTLVVAVAAVAQMTYPNVLEMNDIQIFEVEISKQINIELKKMQNFMKINM